MPAWPAPARPRPADLVLVGGVEGNLHDLGVLLPHLLHGPTAQLNALQQRRLGGVTRNGPLRTDDTCCHLLASHPEHAPRRGCCGAGDPAQNTAQSAQGQAGRGAGGEPGLLRSRPRPSRHALPPPPPVGFWYTSACRWHLPTLGRSKTHPFQPNLAYFFFFLSSPVGKSKKQHCSQTFLVMNLKIPGEK